MNTTARSRHLACSCDTAYLPHLATMLRTLADHNDTDQIHVHFLSAVEDETELRRFCTYIQKLGFAISVIDIDPQLFASYPLHGHVTAASYYRLAIPSVLPQDVSRLLFLDCDMCIAGDLSPLWTMDLQGHLLAAVASPDDPKGDRERLTMGPEDLYFNAGMMVMDLAGLRTYRLLDKSHAYLEKYRERIQWWDQDILNGLLHAATLELDCSWNYLPLHGNCRDANDVRVVHFSGGGSRKPWHYSCRSEFQPLYSQARSRTPWRRYRLDGAPSRLARAKSLVRRSLDKLLPIRQTK